jgi:hypothetical protein
LLSAKFCSRFWSDNGKPNEVSAFMELIAQKGNDIRSASVVKDMEGQPELALSIYVSLQSWLWNVGL